VPNKYQPTSQNIPENLCFISRAEISNPGTQEANADGLLKHWQLVLYGTEENPLQHQEGWSLARPARPSGEGMSGLEPPSIRFIINCLQMKTFIIFSLLPLSSSSVGWNQGLVNYLGTKSNVVIYKYWPLKGLCRQVFIDMRYCQSCKYFRPSFMDCCPSNLLSGSTGWELSSPICFMNLKAQKRVWYSVCHCAFSNFQNNVIDVFLFLTSYKTLFSITQWKV
jgi:hypothetical protein